jgi:hypothetical protein
VGFTTAAQVLYTRLGLPYPPAKADGSEWILIYGGSTSVGLFAIQLAKLAGFKVVSTASPRNFDLVKKFGADEVVDYHNAEEAVEQIKKITGGKITKALDTISEGESFKICLESFADAGKRKYNMLLPISEEGKKLAESKGIETETTLAYTLQGNVSRILPFAVTLLTPRRPSNSCPAKPCPPSRPTASFTSSSTKTRLTLLPNTTSSRTRLRTWTAASTVSWRASS